MLVNNWWNHPYWSRRTNLVILIRKLLKKLLRLWTWQIDKNVRMLFFLILEHTWHGRYYVTCKTVSYFRTKRWFGITRLGSWSLVSNLFSFFISFDISLSRSNESRLLYVRLTLILIDFISCGWFSPVRGEYLSWLCCCGAYLSVCVGMHEYSTTHGLKSRMDATSTTTSLALWRPNERKKKLKRGYKARTH